MLKIKKGNPKTLYCTSDNEAYLRKDKELILLNKKEFAEEINKRKNFD